MSGMNFFEQSIYAIEEFIGVRKKLNLFKSDKYFLVLTAASPENNVNLTNQGNTATAPSLDQAEEGSSGEPVTATKNDQFKTQVLSSWHHTFKHFQTQLRNLKNPRR